MSTRPPRKGTPSALSRARWRSPLALPRESVKKGPLHPFSQTRGSRRRAEGVDDAVLKLAQLLGGDEVGGRGEEKAIGALGGGPDPGADLVERASGAVGLDHLVADRRRDSGEVAA